MEQRNYKFKKEKDYDPAAWTKWDNIVESIDCEGNVIFTKVVDQPCD